MLSPAGREPCQHCLQNPLARQDDQCPGEQLDAVGCNCVAFCVAVGHDPLISRATPRLFGSCPRHFTPAGPSMVPAGCFLRGILPRLRKPGHLGPGLLFLGRRPVALKVQHPAKLNAIDEGRPKLGRASKVRAEIGWLRSRLTNRPWPLQ